MSHQTFLSYSYQNIDVARRLYTALEDTGMALWMDHYDLTPGEHYVRSIDDALKSCEVMIVLHTHDAAQSDEVLAEWYAFYRQHKPIITLVMDGSDLNYMLMMKHTIDCRDRDFASIVALVEASLHHHYARLYAERAPVALAQGYDGESPEVHESTGANDSHQDGKDRDPVA